MFHLYTYTYIPKHSLVHDAITILIINFDRNESKCTFRSQQKLFVHILSSLHDLYSVHNFFVVSFCGRNWVITEFTSNNQNIDTAPTRNIYSLSNTHCELNEENLSIPWQFERRTFTSVDWVTTVHIQKPHTHNVVVIVRENWMTLSMPQRWCGGNEQEKGLVLWKQIIYSISFGMVGRRW